MRVRASEFPHSCPKCEGMNGPPEDLYWDKRVKQIP